MRLLVTAFWALVLTSAAALLVLGLWLLATWLGRIGWVVLPAAAFLVAWWMLYSYGLERWEE